MKRIDELAITIGVVFLTAGLNLNTYISIGCVLIIIGIINRIEK